MSERALAPLSGAEHGRVRVRQPFIWRLQQWLSNYLPLALMALLALFTTWLLKQAPSVDGPEAAVPARSTPDYQMMGFELQRFGPDGNAQAWLRGAALRHYPSDDRIEFDRIHLRVRGDDGSWMLAEAEHAVGPQSGDWLRLRGQVQVRRFAPGGDADMDLATAPPVMTLHTTELLAERHGRRLSSQAATRVLTPRTQAQVAGFQYEHGSGQLRFSGPSHFEFPVQKGAR